MNMSPNSSCSYCVTYPDGNTRHSFPSAEMVRVGMLGEVHFGKDRRGRLGVRDGSMGRDERIGVPRLGEFDEQSRIAGILVYPEVTPCGAQPVAPVAQPREVRVALKTRHF